MSAPRALASFALVALVASATAVHAQLDPALSGVFSFAGGAAEERALARAVDEVCAPMDAVTRLFARPALLDRNRSYREVELRLTRDAVRLRLDHWSTPEISLGGGCATTQTEREEAVVLCAVVREGGVVVRRETSQGVRTDTFRLHVDGDTLSVLSTVESPRLPRVLRFRFTYHRSG